VGALKRFWPNERAGTTWILEEDAVELGERLMAMGDATLQTAGPQQARAMYEQALVALVRALGAQHPTVHELGRKLNALMYNLEDKGGKAALAAVRKVEAMFSGRPRPPVTKKKQTAPRKGPSAQQRVKHRRGDPNCPCGFCHDMRELMPPGGTDGAVAAARPGTSDRPAAPYGLEEPERAAVAEAEPEEVAPAAEAEA
jgi:hypothetical protein